MPKLFKHVNCPANFFSAFDSLVSFLKRLWKVCLCHGMVTTKTWQKWLSVNITKYKPFTIRHLEMTISYRVNDSDKGGQVNFSVICNGHYKACIVLDSCRTTERNGNLISGDVTDGVNTNNYNWHLYLVFAYNLATILDFLILQDKYNIRTFSLNIKSICILQNRPEKLDFYMFLKLV